MKEIKHSSLLSDLLALYKRYGTLGFCTLAEQLKNPDFVREAVILLESVSQNLPELTCKGKTGKRVVVKGNLLLQMASTAAAGDSKKEDLLKTIAHYLCATGKLKTKKEIMGFAARHDFAIDSKTRIQDAVRILFCKIAAMPTDHVAEIAEELCQVRTASDSSLQAWSEIILGKGKQDGR